jgi:aryl-alcohol dehydrogenase-like predicted oxidoreductase
MGVLAGTPRNADAVRRKDPGVQEQLRQHADQLTAYEKLCAGLGHTPADVALAWLLHRPVVREAPQSHAW